MCERPAIYCHVLNAQPIPTLCPAIHRTMLHIQRNFVAADNHIMTNVLRHCRNSSEERGIYRDQGLIENPLPFKRLSKFVFQSFVCELFE